MTTQWLTSTQRFFNGVELIKKYDPNAEIDLGGDVIFFGDYEKSASKMTPEELQLMDDWFWREQAESWATFL